jgi:hypothetical protein
MKCRKQLREIATILENTMAAIMTEEEANALGELYTKKSLPYG